MRGSRTKLLSFLLAAAAALTMPAAALAAPRAKVVRYHGYHVLGDEAHELFLLWWYRIVPYRSYVEGWKISPSHYLNQDLATIWLNK